MRRGSYFEDASFLSTSSAGSGPGNDVFTHAPSGYDGTPSPPPPSAGMHYAQNQPVGYSQSMASEARSGYGGHPAPNQFYLPPHHHGLAPSAHPVPSNGHGHDIQPARLDTINALRHRPPPMLSPSSPVSNSPLSAGLPGAASYERDKRYERDADHLYLAQTPLGTEQAYRMGKAPSYMPRDGQF